MNNNERAQSLNIDSGNTTKKAQDESSFVMNLKGKNTTLDQSNILDQTKNQ